MKRGTPEHPKTRSLAKALGIPLPYAVGLLEMMWHSRSPRTMWCACGSVSTPPESASEGWQRGCSSRLRASSSRPRRLWS